MWIAQAPVPMSNNQAHELRSGDQLARILGFRVALGGGLGVERSALISRVVNGELVARRSLTLHQRFRPRLYREGRDPVKRG